jgi:hypothetical protein
MNNGKKTYGKCNECGAKVTMVGDMVTRDCNHTSSGISVLLSAVTVGVGLSGNK